MPNLLHNIKAILWMSLAWFSYSHAESPQVYNLEQLETMALQHNHAIQAANYQLDAAKAVVITAGTFPNPDIEFLYGKHYQRTTSADTREPYSNRAHSRSLGITQPLDLPWRRIPRIKAAEAGLRSAEFVRLAFEIELIARVRMRFFDLLRRQAEEVTSREDLNLVTAMHSRIALRVGVGEAARYELFKAEAEMLNAKNMLQSAELRTRQALAALRGAVGSNISANFRVEEHANNVPPLADISVARKQIVNTNPELSRLRAEQERAQHQLRYEQGVRMPQFSLRAIQEHSTDLRNTYWGLLVTVPLWDRRVGPIAEANAHVSRLNQELIHQEFSLQQMLEIAYQQYEIAQAQVHALESGIVKKAENALRVAESAYLFGERGFLDVLDAQRVYRAARNNLITARYDVSIAWTEIERLRATH